MSVDLTLYHAVKAKFSSREGELVLVSMVGDDIDQFEVHVFDGEGPASAAVFGEHIINHLPYAVFRDMGKDRIYCFTVPEFYQGEILATGEVFEFVMDPFLMRCEVDLVTLKREIAGVFRALRRKTE